METGQVVTGTGGRTEANITMSTIGALEEVVDAVNEVIDQLCLHTAPEGNERADYWTCCFCLAKSTLRRRLLQERQRPSATPLLRYVRE